MWGFQNLKWIIAWNPFQGTKMKTSPNYACFILKSHFFFFSHYYLTVITTVPWQHHISPCSSASAEEGSAKLKNLCRPDAASFLMTHWAFLIKSFYFFSFLKSFLIVLSLWKRRTALWVCFIFPHLQVVISSNCAPKSLLTIPILIFP